MARNGNLGCYLSFRDKKIPTARIHNQETLKRDSQKLVAEGRLPASLFVNNTRSGPIK